MTDDDKLIRSALIAAGLLLGGMFALWYWIAVVPQMQPRARAPAPIPTPWIVDVVTMPGLEDQIADNPAVLRCRLKAGDRWFVHESVEFPKIGLYIRVSATVDGKPCYGWVKEWR